MLGTRDRLVRSGSEFIHSLLGMVHGSETARGEAVSRKPLAPDTDVTSPQKMGWRREPERIEAICNALFVWVICSN